MPPVVKSAGGILMPSCCYMYGIILLFCLADMHKNTLRQDFMLQAPV